MRRSLRRPGSRGRTIHRMGLERFQVRSSCGFHMVSVFQNRIQPPNAWRRTNVLQRRLRAQALGAWNADSRTIQARGSIGASSGLTAGAL
jgi:hypothetical protein